MENVKNKVGIFVAYPANWPGFDRVYDKLRADHIVNFDLIYSINEFINKQQHGKCN